MEPKLPISMLELAELYRLYEVGWVYTHRENGKLEGDNWLYELHIFHYYHNGSSSGGLVLAVSVGYRVELRMYTSNQSGICVRTAPVTNPVDLWTLMNEWGFPDGVPLLREHKINRLLT